MRTRSKIESDGSVTERTNLSDMPKTSSELAQRNSRANMPVSAPANPKKLADRYAENKGGYARALQSGKISEKNGKKVVTDPDTGLEYEYKGSPEKTSEKTKQGLSKINNQIDGDQRAARRIEKDDTLYSTFEEYQKEISESSGKRKIPIESSAIGNTAEKRVESKKVMPKSNSAVANTSNDKEREDYMSKMSKSYSQEEKENFWKEEQKRRASNKERSSAVRGFGKAVGSAIASPFVGFSERYKKAREQERRERGLTK